MKLVRVEARAGIITVTMALLISSLIIPFVGAQNLEWQRTYGGNGDDCDYTVQQTADGGYILAGNTPSFGAGGSDVYVVKTDASGIMQWQKTFGGAGEEATNSIRRTSDGGYIIGAETSSFGAGGMDYYLIKLDSNYNKEWSKTYGGAGDEYITSARQTADGGYFMAGQTPWWGVTYLVKTDKNGVEEWEKLLYDGHADSAECTADGGYVVVGFTQNLDVWLCKTDAAGVVQWEKTYGGSGWDRGVAVKQTNEG